MDDAPGRTLSDIRGLAPVQPEDSAERYEVLSLLGRGGMGSVYRVRDRRTDLTLALKQLHLPAEPQKRALVAALFEQEYRTLAQLDHPRVIRVYDYGISKDGPYYSMELLEGESLTERAPLGWRELCVLAHDVCSSLALLHARGLIHRDVSPHNVRIGRDGRAKLIDFGAMTSMGPSEQVVGTPACMAPEVAHRLTLDARTDLFSLGATMYFGLTGRLAYPARGFAQLVELWRTRPLPPSAASERDIPAHLDALVMSLISLEPALRPRSAADVMQQLAGMAGLSKDERLDVSRVYLATPELIGRDALLRNVRRRAQKLGRERRVRGGGLFLLGGPGMGRSRALDAGVLQAKTQGALALHASCKGTGARPFALVQTLTERLFELAPQPCARAAERAATAELMFEPACEAGQARLKAFAAGSGERAALQDGLLRFWCEITRELPIALAVDDVDAVDEPSGAFLAALADRARQRRLLLVCSANSDAAQRSELLQAIASRCEVLSLEPLAPEQVEQLLRSMFGDAPNLALLSDRVYRVAQGNPRACLEIVQQLVSRGVISYAEGSWSLPARLATSDLPNNLDELLAGRVEALSPAARQLANLHALCVYGGLSFEDHAELERHAQAMPLTAAREELLSQGVLRGDGLRFRIANDALSGVLLARASPAERSACHHALGELGLATGRHPLQVAQHFLGAGQAARALDLLAPVLGGDIERYDLAAAAQMNLQSMAQLLLAALRAAEQLPRPARELAELRRWLVLLSPTADDGCYAYAAAAWLQTLRRDSGLTDYDALAHVQDEGQRMTQALQQAVQRYAATPDHERTYRVDEAIRYLVLYLVVSITLGTRMFDSAIIRSLPGLLAPYARLTPLLAVMVENALATRETMEGNFFSGRARWGEVFERLATVSGDAARYVPYVRAGIAFVLGLLEAARGMASAENWFAQLEKVDFRTADPMHLRKVICLQQGDFEGAERCRRNAELIALQLGSVTMFSGTLAVELVAHAMANDLSGVRHVLEQMQRLADRYPGWLAYRHLAAGRLELLRGDPRAAKSAFEQALAHCAPDSPDPARNLSAWPMVAGAYLEALNGLGEFEQARAFALRTLDSCDLRTADDVVRGLAEAETRLGDYPRAAARLDELIARQRELGVRGLYLGASYEMRARIAIWAHDSAALDQFSRLAAQEYRHGRGSGLGARYEKLMAEARRARAEVQAQASQFEQTMLGATSHASHGSALAQWRQVSAEATTPEQRAQRALELACRITAADGGQFFWVLEDGRVKWAASYTDAPPDVSMLLRAQEALDYEQSQELAETLFHTTPELDLPLSTATGWTNAQGVKQRALLITSAGELRYLAVLVLSSPRSPEQLPRGHALLRAIGQTLWSAGDTRGVAAAPSGT